LSDTALLTVARRAVWAAIDNWPALKTAFKRKYKLEGPGSSEPPGLIPSIGELPSIGVYPAPSESPWALNKAMALRYSLQIEFWTPHWDILTFEYLWEEITKALFQSAADDSPPYIEDAVGQMVTLGPFTTEIGNLQGNEDKIGPKARRSVQTITVVNEAFDPTG